MRSIGQAGVLDVETAKEIGKIAGIDTILVGRVLQYKVDQNESEGRKTVTVQVGTRTVPNPAYQIFLAEVGAGRKKMSDGAPPQTIHKIGGAAETRWTNEPKPSGSIHHLSAGR